MEFTIYDISDVVDENANDFIFEDCQNDLIEVEMGLSSGEVRQSLLDRFRSAVRNRDINFVDINLSKYGFNVDENSVESEEDEDSVISDIDSILYDLEDEDITDTTWTMPQETIYIKGEEW